MDQKKPLEPIYIEQSKQPSGGFVPDVALDKEKGVFRISGDGYNVGMSIYESEQTFWRLLFDWMEAYRQDPAPQTVLEFRMHFFDSSFSKSMLKMMLMLEGLPESRVVWHYYANDVDMLEFGEEYAADLMGRVKFELRPSQGPGPHEAPDAASSTPFA